MLFASPHIAAGRRPEVFCAAHKSPRVHREGEFDPEWPMICFTESAGGETAWHAQRFGSLGLGFTRKFVFQNHGRPVVYFDRQVQSPFLTTLLKVLRAAKKSGSAGIVDSLNALCAQFKAYKMRVVRNLQPDRPVPRSRIPRVTEESHDLFIRFGGPRTNLEDREWQILHSERVTEPVQRLRFEAGELALVVLPDHATLSLALSEPQIVEKLQPKGGPDVCLISRDMLPSISG